MKKIVCLLLALLPLLSLATLVVGAVTDTSDVMDDLSKVKIDGEAFSPEKHLADADVNGLTLITVIEQNLKNTSYSPDYDLFFYVYNPSGIVFQDSEWNNVLIAMDDQSAGYHKIGLEILSRSSDEKFLKLRVVDSQLYATGKDQCYLEHANPGERIYNVASFHLVSNGELIGYKIGEAFVFSGYQADNTLSCQSKKFHTEKIKLHDASWVSPNAGLKVDGDTPATIYDHYEIHTVYFTLPNYLFKKYDPERGYDYLKSIRADYDEVHLTPIIVTREKDKDFADEEGQLTKNKIVKGETIEVEGDLDVYDLFLDYASGEKKAYLYSEQSVSDFVSNVLPGGTELIQFNTLAYYFANLPSDFDYSSGNDVCEAAVSSEELKAYFEERWNDPNYDKTKLYSEYKPNREIDFNSIDFDLDAVYNMTTFKQQLSKKNFIASWWTNLTTEDDSYLYEDFGLEAPILEVINPADYIGRDPSEYKKIANEELFIGVHDLTSDNGFFAVCEQALVQNCQVVVLRLGFKDYRCQPVRDGWELWLNFGPLKAVWIDKWAYRNITVGQAIFFNNNEEIIVPLVSNKIDSYGDSPAYGDGGINKDDVVSGIQNAVSGVSSLFNNLRIRFDSFKKILFGVAIVLVVFVLIWLFLKFKPQKGKHEYPDQDKRRRWRK